MTKLAEKKVKVTADNYRELSQEAVEHAVGWIRQDENGIGRAARLAHAAEMLRAADTFERRAVQMENFEWGPDEALVETF